MVDTVLNIELTVVILTIPNIIMTVTIFKNWSIILHKFIIKYKYSYKKNNYLLLCIGEFHLMTILHPLRPKRHRYRHHPLHSRRIHLHDFAAFS